MNHMAAAGMVQQAAAGPEIIVVNDGKPVESVDNKSRAIIIGKYAGMLLAPLIVGLVVGQMSQTAKSVNRTIDDAKDLHADINKIRTSIYEGILTPLLEARERGPGGNAFKPGDEKLTEALGVRDRLPRVDLELAFSSYMFDMDKKLVGDILAFYSLAAALRKDVDAHVAAAKEDAKHIADGEKFMAEARPDAEVNDYLKGEYSRYGIFIEIPTRREAEQGAKFGAKLVEIGPPFCQDRRASTTGTCQGPPIGLGYRASGSGGDWQLMEFAFPQGETVGSRKLLPLIPTQSFESLIKGGDASVSEVSYMRRVNDLFERTNELVEFGTSLERALRAKANQSKSFTFFL